MTIKLGVVMDPIASIHFKKDSTLALLFEAEKRGFELYYFEQQDLFLRDGKAFGNSRLLKIFRDPARWFELSERQCILLSDLNVILMRKDPPFNLDYIYTTYLLEHAERDGVLVVNKPQSLRDANEKLFATRFPACCPPTLVTSNISFIRDFFKEHQDIICKPLDGMGGSSVFRLTFPDKNASVVFETLTKSGTTLMMTQRFIPAIFDGDKRILMINGEPIPYALARIPAEGELRGNLAAGARGVAQPLTTKDRWIAEEVGSTLREKGLFFVGLDVIGDYLTEINVTSPTCIRELDEQCNLNISAQLFDALSLS
ncbi:MAG TPA: glutathione synthase [Gammaproteobacteria bacterium]|nr:glutathione synthase [Gammaproteobacteria bacterium]